MSRFPLRVNEGRMREVVAKNLLRRPTKTFSRYSFYGANCARLAQSLRQKTLGMATEFTAEDLEANPAGTYFLQVESTLLRLANSLSEAGAVLVLSSIGDTDIDVIMEAAGKRLSRVLGAPTDSGTKTKGMTSDEKVAAYLATHHKALRELAELLDLGLEGLQIGIGGASLRNDLVKMLEFLRKELETANTLFGRAWWTFWR